MTAPSAAVPIKYNGDGVITDFAIPFFKDDDDHLRAGVSDGTDETLHVNNAGFVIIGDLLAGFEVRFDAAPPVGVNNVIIWREEPSLNTTNLKDLRRLPAETIETMADRVARAGQDAQASKGFTFQLSATDHGTLRPFPLLSVAVGKYIAIVADPDPGYDFKFDTAQSTADVAIVAANIVNIDLVAGSITNVNLVGADLALGGGSFILAAPAAAIAAANDATFSAAVQSNLAQRWLGSHVNETALLAAFIPGTHLDGAFGINEANGLVGVVFNNGANVAYGSAGDALLSDLASTANAKGASLIGVEDAAALLAASTVEGALAELAAGRIGQFSVKDFGATGDGVTDDTTAVNDALAAVIAAGGGDLFFPDGATYVLDGVSATALVNCRLTGHGATLQLPPLGTSRSVILTLIDSTDVEIDGLIFDGQNDTRTGTGVGDFGALIARTDLPQDALLVLKNCKRIDVHHNTLKDVRIEAVRIADGTDACQDVDLHHNKFSECGFGVWADGEGVAADNATNSVRIHFRFNRYGGDLWNNVGVQFNLCDDMAGSIIEGNYFENSVRPNIALAMCRDVKIVNNTCFRNVTHTTKQACIHVETDCESTSIRGNYVNNSVDGYGILYKQGNDSGIVADNIVGRCESYGIYFPTSLPNRKGLTPQWTLDETAISDHIRSTMVSGNNLINNDGIRFEKQSTGEMQRIVIVGNKIQNSGSHGIAFLGDTLDDFVDIIISGNLIVSPTIDSIFLEYCSRGSITGNVLTSGLTGINLDNSTIMSVSGNTLRSHSVGGIVEANGANSNNIHGNNISNVTTNPIVRLGATTRVGGNVTGQTLVVASATTLTLPAYADEIINITGTTQIEGIAAGSYWEGRKVSILFSGVLTMKDGIGNLRLNGDFITSAGDTISLMGFSGNFYEVSRSDNG